MIWLKRFDVAYLEEVRAWTAAIRVGAPTGPSAWDGYISMVIADACIQSALMNSPQPVSSIARPPLYDRT